MCSFEIFILFRLGQKGPEVHLMLTLARASRFHIVEQRLPRNTRASHITRAHAPPGGVDRFVRHEPARSRCRVRSDNCLIPSIVAQTVHRSGCCDASK